jgi:hypothetical protein
MEKLLAEMRSILYVIAVILTILLLIIGTQAVIK